MLDVGNQGFEGSCDWHRADRVLGDHWQHLGVKDVCRRAGAVTFCSCVDGDADYRAIHGAWSQRARSDWWVLQPFYHDADLSAHLAELRREVAWLRQVMQALAVGAE